VLDRLSRGDPNKVIARQMGIREGTVKVYVRQIMRKLGVGNRTQLAIAWASLGGMEGRTGDRKFDTVDYDERSTQHDMRHGRYGDLAGP